MGCCMRKGLTAVGRAGCASIVILAVAATGCSNKSPAAPAPPPINLAGVWVGAVTVAATTARMTWTLAQSDSSVTGPVLLGVSDGTVLLNGSLNGTLAGSTLTYTISVTPGGIPAQPNCSGQIGGTMTATIGVTSTLTGSSAITSSTCSPAPFTAGNLTLTRQ